MKTNLPILYSFRRCPYAIRARTALALSSIPYILREIDLKNKAPELLEASPKGTVPVLKLPSGQILEESLEIVDWAIQHTQNPIWTQDIDPQLIQAYLAPLQHDYIPALNRFKYPDQHSDHDRHADQAQLLEHLTHWNNQLIHQRFLCTEMPSSVDIALFPMIRQTHIADAQWFDTLPLPALHTWFQGWLNTLEQHTIMTKHIAWQAGDEPIVIENTAFSQ
jgi:glutathione S-transferase